MKYLHDYVWIDKGSKLAKNLCPGNRLKFKSDGSADIECNRIFWEHHMTDVEAANATYLGSNSMITIGQPSSLDTSSLTLRRNTTDCGDDPDISTIASMRELLFRIGMHGPRHATAELNPGDCTLLLAGFLGNFNMVAVEDEAEQEKNENEFMSLGMAVGSILDSPNADAKKRKKAVQQRNIVDLYQQASFSAVCYIYIFSVYFMY